MVNAIDLILTNQQNDFLIQWEENKTQQPRRCKNKLYAKICYQINLYVVREIYKHIENFCDT